LNWSDLAWCARKILGARSSGSTGRAFFLPVGPFPAALFLHPNLGCRSPGCPPGRPVHAVRAAPGGAPLAFFGRRTSSTIAGFAVGPSGNSQPPAGKASTRPRQSRSLSSISPGPLVADRRQLHPPFSPNPSRSSLNRGKRLFLRLKPGPVATLSRR